MMSEDLDGLDISIYLRGKQGSYSLSAGCFARYLELSYLPMSL